MLIVEFQIYLEVGVRYDGCGLSKVADLLEPGHDLWTCNATVLIHQLDGSSETVMGHTVSDEHVEFILVILDG